jgi:hypothetical protein
LKILQLKISLDHTRVNREVLVRKDITYHELHRVIQRVFGWEDYHLYEFNVEGDQIGDLENDEFGSIAYEAMTTPIFSDKKKFSYEYDFGDGWEHTIRIVKELEADPAVDYPVCIGGKRACPPEDCGGIYGYREILKTVSSGSTSKKEELEEWLGYEFDPDDFSVEWANERLEVLILEQSLFGTHRLMHDQGEMHDRVSTHGEGVTDDTTEMSLLTRYIVALTNLYGVLPEEELVKIFSAQNEDQISLEELESWADNHSEELYGTPVSSVPGLFIHEDLMDVDVFKDLMMKKANKPYYVPEKEELLKYVNPHYPESTKELDALLDYIKKHLISNEEDALDIVEDIHDYCKSGVDMRSVMDLFNDYEVSFDSMEQVNEVLQLVTSVANNIRIWENNGYTPHEIFEKYEKPNMKPLPDKPFVYKGGEQTVVKGEKVGRNDPCPCGSGKKYKKCCLGKDLYH